MHITVNYSDITRIFNLSAPGDFAPGIELREDGVFVKYSGDSSSPVLALPCELDELQQLLKKYGISCTAIDPVDLLRFAKERFSLQAKLDALAEVESNWSVVSGLYDLKDKLNRDLDNGAADARRGFISEMLLTLNKLVPGEDDGRHGPEGSDSARKTPDRSDRPLDPRERKTLLRIIGGLTRLVGFDLKQPNKDGGAIANELARAGVNVAASTIGRHLKTVPEAMDSRKE